MYILSYTYLSIAVKGFEKHFFLKIGFFNCLSR